MKITLAGVAAWARQITTGAGFTAAASAVGGYLTHGLTGPQAAVGVLGGIVLMIWPEMPKATAVAVAVPVAATLKDVLVQVMARKLDPVVDFHDALAVLAAVEAALPALAPAPNPAAAAVAAAAIAAA